MVELILKYLNKIKQLFVIIPVVIGVMLIVGLYFANKKSEPMFVSKIDKVMFDTENKSPKYVITLPEPENSKKVVQQPVEEIVKREKPGSAAKPKTNDEKLSELDIPFLARLVERESTEPLDVLLPDESVSETQKDGAVLPLKIGINKAWEKYGKKVPVMPMFNKVVVVIMNMGINKVNSDLIATHLPENVSLSFSPYAVSLKDSVKLARENGHETYLDIILPSRNYLLEDSGPKALNFDREADANVKMLEDLLAQSMAVGGFIIRDGIDDEQYNKQFLAIMEMFEKRGLLMLDSTRGVTISKNNVQGLDRVKADIVIDSDYDREIIREKFRVAEQIAYRKGDVVVAVEPKPVVILELAKWLDTFSTQLSYEEMKEQKITDFEKPLALVPLSNLAVEY